MILFFTCLSLNECKRSRTNVGFAVNDPPPDTPPMHPQNRPIVNRVEQYTQCLHERSHGLLFSIENILKNLDICYAVLSKQSTLGLFDMVAQDFGRFI